MSKKIEDNYTWNIKITSKAPTHGLSELDINNALLAIRSKFITEWRKSHNDKAKKQFPQEVAVWQIDKGVEFEDKFVDNLKIEYSPSEVKVSTKFSVGVTKEFDRGSVLDWSEGFNRLNKAYAFDYSEKIANNWSKTKEILDDPNHNSIKKLFSDLLTNQKFDITK